MLVAGTRCSRRPDCMCLMLTGGPITETETVSVARYLEQNGTGFLGFDVPAQAAFFGAKSLFSAKDLATHCEREPCKARRLIFYACRPHASKVRAMWRAARVLQHTQGRCRHRNQLISMSLQLLPQIPLT